MKEIVKFQGPQLLIQCDHRLHDVILLKRGKKYLLEMFYKFSVKLS